MPGKSHNDKGILGKCLSGEQLYRYLEKLLSREESQAVQVHLDSCSVCFKDMVALARNAHTPASEAEKVELASLPKLSPQEQVVKILGYVESECQPEVSTLNGSARKALDDSSMLSMEKSFWQDLWQRVVSPRLLPRYAFAAAALLILVAGTFVGIRYYQNTYPLAQVERDLRSHYQAYVNLQNYAESMPRLSGGYAHQPFMLMSKDSVSYLEQSRRRLQAVLAKEAKSVRAQHLLAKILVMQGAYAQADSVLQQIPATALQDASLLNDQGVLHLLASNLPAAAQDFAAAIKADPRLAEAKYNLALTKAKMGATAEATALLHEYLQLETDSGWREATKSILQDDLEKEK
jgi:hypothetical protein